MPCRQLRRPNLLAISLFLAFCSQPSIATPLRPEDEIIRDLQNTTSTLLASTLLPRGCANPCGYDGWLCCGSGQYCYTDSNWQAQCGSTAAAAAYTTPAPGGGGYWHYWTSTYVQTNLVTMTKTFSSWCPTPTSSWVAPVSTTAAPVTCNWASGESSCGNICCTSWQYCAVEGQCAQAGAYTSSYSPAIRPTSQGVIVATATITTTTRPFIPAIPSAQAVESTAALSTSSSSGLSGGAIAGIVIGIIIAIIILIIICLFLCFRAAWDGLLAIFGLGPRQRRRREVEERYYHHGSRADSRRWHGDRTSRVETKKKSSGLGWGGVAAGLGGLALALGLKRRSDRKRHDEKSDYSSSSYDYSSSYDTGTSSSGRRTHDTRRSRR